MKYILLGLITQAAVVTASLNPIEIKGSKFFDSVTKKQFIIEGASYQPRTVTKVDPLAVPKFCARDAPYLKQLGINTIRVFETYPNHNHDECMKIFEDNGIYVLLDLPIPEYSINREHPVYFPEILTQYKQKIDAFAKYNNTLGFFAGNEISNDPQASASAAYAKAALRDAKAYMKTKSRYIPIGYADNDDPRVRIYNQNYFTCGKPEEQVDFYAVNTYRWCGDSNFIQSRYNELIDELQHLSIPTFLSEYGCNTPKVRTFNEINEIYGNRMGKVLSGGLVYEYSNETNAYGLVTIDKGKVTPHQDYWHLRKQLTKVKLDLVNYQTYSPSTQSNACPVPGDHYKSNSILPPTPNLASCECIYRSLACRVTPKAHDPFYKELLKEKLDAICGSVVDCSEIQSDSLNAIYGPYSTCPDYIQSSIIFNRAYECHKDCNFDGLAALSPVAPSATPSDQCPTLPLDLTSPPPTFPPLFNDLTPDAIQLSETYTYSTIDPNDPNGTDDDDDNDDSTPPIVAPTIVPDPNPATRHIVPGLITTFLLTIILPYLL